MRPEPGGRGRRRLGACRQRSTSWFAPTNYLGYSLVIPTNGRWRNAMVTAEATLTRGTYQTTEDSYPLGEFDSFRGAEKMVDRLSDAEFPVEQVRIVVVE